jgi:predicted nucleic acid-binding protein
VNAVDTSVVVALFASWHERHDDAVALVNRGDVRLLAHVAAETYSVLTRLPAPHRAPAEVVRDFLLRQFREPWLTLSSRDLRRVLRRLPESGIRGGATYDAVIAATAQSAGAMLVSFDERAVRTYEALGVSFRRG